MSAFIVNYINPIGIQNLQWRYYILTIVFACVIWVLIYFTFVETRGLSLEEIAIIFDGREGFDAAIAAVQADHKKPIEEENDKATVFAEVETRQ